jgi:hypothetical protein
LALLSNAQRSKRLIVRRHCFEGPIRASLKDRRPCQAAQSKGANLGPKQNCGKLEEEERERLARAIAALEESTSPRIVVKKTSVAAQQPASAKGNKLGGITPEGRKRLSLAMKKRLAEREKKGS